MERGRCSVVSCHSFAFIEYWRVERGISINWRVYYDVEIWRTVEMRQSAITIVVVLIMMFGLLLVRPELVFEFMESLTIGWLFGVAALRIGLGALVIGAASSARMPCTLKVLGAFFILAGFFTPVLGVENLRTLVGEIYGESVAMIRMGMIFGIAFLVFLVYALLSAQEKAGAATDANQIR